MTAQTFAAPRADRPAWVVELHLAMKLAVLVAAAVLAFSFVQDVTARQLFYVRLFDVDEESCPFTWISTVTLFGSAVLAWRTASLHRSRRLADWPMWGLLAAFMVFLSSEEVVGLHERLSLKGDIMLRNHGINYHMIWAAPALVFCAVLAVLARPFVRGLPRRTRRAMLAAAAVYVGGAAGLEFVQSIVFIFEGWFSPPMVIMRHLEEALELAGALMMLSALADHRAAEDASGGPVEQA